MCKPRHARCCLDVPVHRPGGGETKCTNSRTGKFLTRTSRPCCGGWVAPDAMGSHHKRFGSARTARCVHTLDLVRAPPRVWQAGAAWKGGQQFGWVIHDCIQIHINMAFNGLESISGLHVPRSDAPKRDWASEHRILLQEVRCRPPKFDSRFPAPLTQDGDAPGTQESHPSATPPTSTRNAWPCFGWWLVNTPLTRTRGTHCSATL